MYNIPRYQTGSYIPGLSSQIFGAGLGRDIASTQEDLRGKAKSLGKKQGWGKFGSFLGSKGGKWAGKALSAGFAATNPLYALAIQAGGAGLGSYLGSKLGRGKDVSLANKHGLLGEQYKDIGKYQRGMESAAKGAAWGDAASVFGEGLKSQAGKSIWGGMDADKKTKWFGENLGSKSHEELSKMRLGNMIGKGRLAQGAEDWLGKFGQKEFETDRLKDTAKWAYGGAKDIYGQYQDYRDYTERNRESSRAGDLSPWERMKMVTGFGGNNQLGGMIGMQEGGLAGKLGSYLSNAYMKKLAGQDPKLQAFAYGEQPQSESVDLKSKIFDIQEAQNNKSLQDFSKSWSQQKYIDEDSPYAGATITDIMEGGDRGGMEQQFLETDEGKYSLGKTHYGGILPSVRNIFSQIPRRVDEVPEYGLPETIEGLQQHQPEQRSWLKKLMTGYQQGGMAYPLQMAGGGYLPEQGYGGLIQHRKGY